MWAEKNNHLAVVITCNYTTCSKNTFIAVLHSKHQFDIYRIHIYVVFNIVNVTPGTNLRYVRCLFLRLIPSFNVL